MNCNRVERLLDAFIDGELDGETMLRMREHLRGCDSCQTELREIRRMKCLVARTLVARPQDNLEERLLAACRDQQPIDKARISIWRPVRTFASVATVAAVATFATIALMPKPTPEKTPESAPIAFEIQRDQIYSVGLDPMAGSPTISTSHGIVP